MKSATHFCFRQSSGAQHCLAPLPVTLSARQAIALAQLVPLLGCGEEAAALAFDGLASRSDDHVAQCALRQIAHEESIHDGLLQQLAASLPNVDTAALRAKARRFHLNLGRGGYGQHLARIAAIDAGVCTVLSRLLHPGRAIAQSNEIANVLARIRTDEARHVAVSRALATRATSPQSLMPLAEAARHALADVLSLAANAFEALGVDPDHLSADLRKVPNGLFAQ